MMSGPGGKLRRWRRVYVAPLLAGLCTLFLTAGGNGTGHGCHLVIKNVHGQVQCSMYGMFGSSGDTRTVPATCDGASTDLPLDGFSDGGLKYSFVFSQTQPVQAIDFSRTRSGKTPVHVGRGIHIPLTIWLVSPPATADGTTDTPETIARAAFDYANAIFLSECTGVSLVWHVHNISSAAHPINSVVVDDFPVWKHTHSHYTRKTVNVYFVRTVTCREDCVDLQGVTDNDGDILISLDAAPDLLLHELGHACGLRMHADHWPTLSATNFMWSTNTQRKYVTDGQEVRMICDGNSQINRLGVNTTGTWRDLIDETDIPTGNFREMDFIAWPFKVGRP